MASKEMSSWINFFTTAGIPAGPALSYATLFVDNRMQINMLMDLNKEYLKDMGVTVMGDIIAILKYAKTAHAEYERDRPALNTSAMKPNAKVELKRHRTAGNRMLEHYMRKEGIIEAEKSPKVSVSPAMAVRLGAVPKAVGVKTSSRQPAAEIVPVKRARKVDPSEEGHYVISMPKGTTPRTKSLLQKQKNVTGSNVFDRLGKEVSGEKTTPKRLGKQAGEGIKTPSDGASGGGGDVFSRLGGVQSQRERTVSGSSEVSVLAYQGILKEGTPHRRPPAQEKTLTVKIPSVFKDRLTGLQRPDSTTTSVTRKGRALEGVRARLGGKPKIVSTLKKKNATSRGGQAAQPKRAGGPSAGAPKVTVTLNGSGGGGVQSPARIRGRLGAEARAGKFSPSYFSKGNVVKTIRPPQPVVVTLVSDKPEQTVTMKERLGIFKAEASSTTPSLTITAVRGTSKRMAATRGGSFGGRRSGEEKSVFNRLGKS